MTLTIGIFLLLIGIISLFTGRSGDGPLEIITGSAVIWMQLSP